MYIHIYIYIYICFEVKECLGAFLTGGARRCGEGALRLGGRNARRRPADRRVRVKIARLELPRVNPV